MWVTETEPEYDVDERESWQALAEYEDAICPKCGGLLAVCSDPDGLTGKGFYPQRHVCYAQAAADRATRKFMAMHKDDKEDAAGYLPFDGVRISASPLDLTPDDDFLSSPEDELLARVLAQQARRDHPQPSQASDDHDESS